MNRQIRLRVSEDSGESSWALGGAPLIWYGHGWTSSFELKYEYVLKEHRRRTETQRMVWCLEKTDVVGSSGWFGLNYTLCFLSFRESSMMTVDIEPKGNLSESMAVMYPVLGFLATEWLMMIQHKAIGINFCCPQSTVYKCS